MRGGKTLGSDSAQIWATAAAGATVWAWTMMRVEPQYQKTLYTKEEEELGGDATSSRLLLVYRWMMLDVQGFPVLALA